ncbi:Major Facilitator Superfamily protein [Colwellia chukchiensis]|uniref:Major Facilitator Superfamily protein n=1 Tax=Colwellia chukchiensis TaxID=641665 RepID=A0A1H7KJY5_9GAMM|nr:MFS transporter [Colwellia chukchiensis]SEK86816.1 Major Facilitator Superfamily protein [Colwellia chukchiensis]
MSVSKPVVNGTNYATWFLFSLMASVTFIGILSELVPSGILPQMTEGLAIAEAQVGFLVGVYALASAIFAIPLISMTLAVNRKTLLLFLLVGFTVSNIVVGLSSWYQLIVVMRIVGGICAGIMWPMIAAYGAALVPKEQQGKAITIIMSGNTFGVSLGLPLMTLIGTELGWRTTFIVLGALGATIALLSAKYLPSIKGEKLTKSNSPWVVLKTPSVLLVLVLTFLSVLAHYGSYTTSHY